MNLQEAQTPVNLHNLSTNSCRSFQQPLLSKNNCIQCKNTFINFNKTLTNLNNDTLKRYNTDINQTQTKRLSFQKINHKSRNLHSYEFYSSVDQVFAPQPWTNEDPFFATQAKQPFTDIRQRNNKLNTLGKSFHISKSVNKSNHKYHNSMDENRNKSLYGKSQKWKQRLDQLMTEQRQHGKSTFQNYNYTSEQKAKVTLDYIVHKKKHSKMSKILKMKTHSFDNTLQKQQKISHHSKNLIEALEKFSNDNMLRKSIDRAVDVLKKRTHNLLYNKTNSRQEFPKTAIDQTSMKWLSCQKISANNEIFKSVPKSKRNDSSMKNIVNADLSINVLKPQKSFEVKQKCKISFKPKRNFIIESRQGKKQPEQKLSKLPVQKTNQMMRKKESSSVKVNIHQVTF